MSTLIVGGTSGLGLEIARNEAAIGGRAIITGRHDPHVRFAEYAAFDLSGGNLPARVGEFVTKLSPIQTLVYAAGFHEDGHIDDFTDEEIDAMDDVCYRGLKFFVKKILEKQNELDELVTITSTSQWTAREFEPNYCSAKSAAAHFSKCVSFDSRIAKTRVIAPSGMDTEHWDTFDNDTSGMMRPEWVAKQVMGIRARDDGYIFAKILGAIGEVPERVIIEEPAPQAENVIKDLWPIGQILAERRSSLGLSMTEAAKLCGISRQMYSNYEKGNYAYQKGKRSWQPRAKSLIKLAEALGINAQTLLTAGGYERPKKSLSDRCGS